MNLFGPDSLNGIGGGIIGEVDLTKDGYKNQGPIVQDQMVFTFYFTGDLSYDEITNVHPLFGSDGVPVPEPSTFILFLSGTGLLAGAARFKRKI